MDVLIDTLDPMKENNANHKVVVLGASTNPDRYSNRAIHRLNAKGYEVIAVGRSTGRVDGVEILAGTPEITEADTLTLYINPSAQLLFKDYILSMKPRRVIFNPGTEHRVLEEDLMAEDIEVVRACTLVMLSAGTF